MFSLLLVGQGILQYLCCTDDQVRVLDLAAKEVLLVTVPTDRHQAIVSTQVVIELIFVVLVDQMNLENITSTTISHGFPGNSGTWFLVLYGI
jgi:predicted nucleic acid-binding protein